MSLRSLIPQSYKHVCERQHCKNGLRKATNFFKLNPIIYLKLLADHYLFSVFSFRYITYVESRLGHKKKLRARKRESGEESCSCESGSRRMRMGKLFTFFFLIFFLIFFLLQSFARSLVSPMHTHTKKFHFS